MIENLTICHIIKSSGDKTPVLDQEEWVLFETCQRKIYLSMTPALDLGNISPKYITKGKSAYSSLLNILCGLESRIVGETEVFGQFKVFANNENTNNPAWFNQFRRIAQYLIIDVKEIRNQYLSSVGLRSYGSLTKYFVNDYKNIAIIGGGQLAQKALPYLNDGSHQISMYLRSPAKAATIEPRLMNNIKIFRLNDQTATSPMQALIVAAPLSTKEIISWLEKSNDKLSIIIDLRDQTSDERLDVDCKLVTLDDLFIQIEKTSKLLQTQITNAKHHISTLSAKRFSVRHFRPFGWEDIYAHKHC